MKKVLYIAICAFLLTSISLAGTSCSSDNSAPEFEGDPINLSGSLKYEDGAVLIDMVITNNTNKGIQVYNIGKDSSFLLENEQDWRVFYDGSDFPFRDSDKWYDKLLKGPTIKAGASKEFSTHACPTRFFDQFGPDTYAEAVKIKIAVTWLEFEGYGRMDLDEPLVCEFEWFR